MESGPISLSPVDTKTVHIHGNPVGVGAVHVHGSMQTGIQIPQTGDGPAMSPWML